MTQIQEKPAAVVALDELARDAKTEEDVALLAQWEDEIYDEREKTLRTKTIGSTVLQEMRDGSLVTPQEVQSEREAGHDQSGPYDHGTRA